MGGRKGWMGMREMGERDRQANSIEQCLKYLQALVYFTVHEQVELDKFKIPSISKLVKIVIMSCYMANCWSQCNMV